MKQPSRAQISRKNFALKEDEHLWIFFVQYHFSSRSSQSGRKSYSGSYFLLITSSASHEILELERENHLKSITFCSVVLAIYYLFAGMLLVYRQLSCSTGFNAEIGHGASFVTCSDFRDFSEKHAGLSFRVILTLYWYLEVNRVYNANANFYHTFVCVIWPVCIILVFYNFFHTLSIRTHWIPTESLVQVWKFSKPWLNFEIPHLFQAKLDLVTWTSKRSSFISWQMP